MKNKQRGAVLLEFCLCVPILLLIILGGFDLERATNAKSNLDYITIATSNCFVRGACSDPQAFAQGLAVGVGLNPMAITVNCAGVGCSIIYNWTAASPFFPPTIEMHSAASGS